MVKAKLLELLTAGLTAEQAGARMGLTAARVAFIMQGGILKPLEERHALAAYLARKKLQ